MKKITEGKILKLKDYKIYKGKTYASSFRTKKIKIK